MAQGFFYPRTATGRASLLPAPPWSYSGDLLTVEYRTDPDRVAALLPAPQDCHSAQISATAPESSGAGSSGASREELLDPVRAQYKEAFVVVRCSYRGGTYSRCVFIWVDKDFAILRGIHQGYPKKLGSMHQTRPHPLPQGAPTLVPGDRLGATLAANDRRLAQAVITLTGPSETAGFVNGHPMAHHRVLPRIDGGGDAHVELIRSGSAEIALGPTFAATVDELTLFASPTEELADLEVREVIGGYYRRLGVVWDGGATLASGSPDGVIWQPAGPPG